MAGRKARASDGDLLGGLVFGGISEHGALEAETPLGLQHGLLQQQERLHRTVELRDVMRTLFMPIFIFRRVERDGEG